MKSAIEEICYAMFAQSDKMKLTEKQKELLDVVIDCDEKLRVLLKENQAALELLEKFKCALDESESEEAFLFYKEGFRNGFQIALDGMDED